MVAMLTRRCGDASLAHDLAQQTWAALWTTVNSGRFDPARAALGTLAYAIALNRLRDHARRTGRAAALATDIEAALGPTPQPADPASLVDQAELLESLRGVLRGERAALDDRELAVARLIASGASDRDLAGQLGISASTANARKNGVLQKLRSLLGVRPERRPAPSESTREGPR